MSYVPNLGIAKTIDLVAQLLIGMPAVATICGTHDPAARLALGIGGQDVQQCSGYDRLSFELAPPMLIISADSAEDRMPGLGSWREEGGILVEIYHAPVAGDRPADAYLRAIDEQEGVLNGLREASRTGDLIAPGLRIANFPAISLPTNPRPFVGSWHSSLIISFSRGIAPS
jgi:hypothetical protein